MEFEVIRDVPNDEAVRQALAWQHAGAFHEAENAYQGFLERNPDSVGGHFLSGLLAYQQVQFALAIQRFERALALDPFSVRCWCMLGRAMHMGGLLVRAEAMYHRALQLDAGHIDSLVGLGTLMGELKRGAEAFSHFLGALRGRPGEPKIYFRCAAALEAAGSIRQAIEMYGKAVELAPRYADAHNNLGLLHMNANDLQLAERHFELAMEAKPDFPEAPYNLAIVRARQQRLREAEQLYLQAIGLRPGYWDALNNLGGLHFRAGAWERALSFYMRAVAAHPGRHAAHGNLVLALIHLDKYDEALREVQDALRRFPGTSELEDLRKCLEILCKYDSGHPTGLSLGIGAAPQDEGLLRALGLLMMQKSRFPLARQMFEWAVARAPGRIDNLLNLATACVSLEDLKRAESALRDALRLAPSNALAINGLVELLVRRSQWQEALEVLSGLSDADSRSDRSLTSFAITYRAAGRIAEAERYVRLALAAAPQDPEKHANLGVVLLDQGNAQGALEAFEGAVDLDPKGVLQRWHRGFCRLLLGDFSGGWSDYELRLDPLAPVAISRRIPDIRVPRWQGEPLAGKRIVVVGEQGFGDQLQFVRYVARLVQIAAAVDVTVRPALRGLVGSMPGIRSMVNVIDPAQHDYYIMMGSLPYVFKTDEASIPSAVPYLYPKDAALAQWRGRLGAAADPSLRVGVVWSGDKQHPNNRNRSIAAGAFEPFKAVPGVAWYAVHKREPEYSALPDLDCVDLSAEIKDFDDAAAVVSLLDLVITVDTATAHLCGALGCPVWVLLPSNPDWRWLAAGDRSAWYPSMKLYRQREYGVWRDLLVEVASDLALLGRTHAASGAQRQMPAAVEFF